jgi:hypothetical protein
MTTDDLYDAFMAQQQTFLSIADASYAGRNKTWQSGHAYPWWDSPVRTVHGGKPHIEQIKEPVVREAAVELLIVATTYLLACSSNVNDAVLWKLGQRLKEEYGLA